MHWPKIIDTREMLMKKKSFGMKILHPPPLPPPINFSNVRPLQEKWI